VVSDLDSTLSRHAWALAYTQYVLLECYSDQVLLTVTSTRVCDGMRVMG
jgi:hypothetical protein